MARRETDFHPGGFYHIYNRGCARNRIFREKRNYCFLLQRLRKYTQSLSISVISYALMPNHFHFELRQDGSASVSRCMQLLFNSYTKGYNSFYHRTGTLFEGPFKSIEIEDENYLLNLSRYIHLNPVEAKLAAKPEDWEFSSYRDWVGMRGDGLADRNFIHRYFPSPAEYAVFVCGSHDETVLRESLLKNQMM
jgi:putative transposase